MPLLVGSLFTLDGDEEVEDEVDEVDLLLLIELVLELLLLLLILPLLQLLLLLIILLLEARMSAGGRWNSKVGSENLLFRRTDWSMTPPLIMTSVASTSVSSFVDGEEHPELSTSKESLLSLKSRRPRWRKSVGESVVLFNGSSSSLNFGDEHLRTELSLPHSAKDGFK
jgi:hypothetical protein